MTTDRLGWLIYGLNVDRTNIGVGSDMSCILAYRKLICTSFQNAKIGGMERDLKLSSSDYSLALSIFFVVNFELLSPPAPK